MNTKLDPVADEETANIAFVGGGPASLVAAIAFARRGIGSTIYERDLDPDLAPRFNPDRSYTIDTSGHGLRALRHIEATSYFDKNLNRFKGIKVLGKFTEEWTEPGWTGSRGDILRALRGIIRDRHGDAITLNFEANVTSVDINTGTVKGELFSGESFTRDFDLVIGGDGAGSVVRRSLENDCEGFTVTAKSYPMYCTMIELDQVGQKLDPYYLHMLSVTPFVVAGAVRGDDGPDSARWFCAVCTKDKIEMQSAEAARQFFEKRSPRVLQYTSETKIAEFCERTCYHIGRSLNCSQLFGGKAVLLGDAAAPFPPIGQGLNAALESSMVLDECIGETGHSPAAILEACRNYSKRWKPEAEAVAWVAERHLAENTLHNLRARITHAVFGLSVVGETKRSDIPYSEVKRKAERLWPLW